MQVVRDCDVAAEWWYCSIAARGVKSHYISTRSYGAVAYCMISMKRHADSNNSARYSTYLLPCIQ